MILGVCEDLRVISFAVRWLDEKEKGLKIEGVITLRVICGLWPRRSGALRLITAANPREPWLVNEQLNKMLDKSNPGSWHPVIRSQTLNYQ